MEMRDMLRLALPLIPAFLMAGCMGENRGLVSAHQPVVADGRATVPGCPDWSDADRQAHESLASNYGCATAQNLAAMIADPNDLVHGRTGTATGETAAKAVKAWRTAPPTGAGQIEKVSAKGGN